VNKTLKTAKLGRESVEVEEVISHSEKSTRLGEGIRSRDNCSCRRNLHSWTKVLNFKLKSLSDEMNFLQHEHSSQRQELTLQLNRSLDFKIKANSNSILLFQVLR